MLTRTEQIWLSSNNNNSKLCHCAKNLWNEANYYVRQEFIFNKKWIRYNTLAGIFKTSENYIAIGAQTGQQVLKVLDRSWKSFFKAIKDWTNHPEKYLGRPRLVNYKPKDGEFMLIFTNQQVKIKDGYLIFPKKLDIQPIKVNINRISDKTDLREVRLIPKGEGYVCEIVYQKIDEEGVINKRWYSKRNNENRIVGIDYGAVNVITMGNNIGLKPIVFKDDGKGIKSINQFYNKEKAKLQSVYYKQNIKYGHKMSALNKKRNLKMKDTLHKHSKSIIDYCKFHNIGRIIIGHNDNWKQNVNMGKKTNQTFVSIPYYILTNMIQYKANEAGIFVKLQEESHTSKCSFLDKESIEHKAKGQYVGKRVKRGLFRSAKGIYINADVNGVYNIISKGDPKAFNQQINADGVGGCGLHPIRVDILVNRNINNI